MGCGEAIDADLALAFIAPLKGLLRVVTSEHNKRGELSRKATGLGLKPHRASAASTNKKCLGEEKTCYSVMLPPSGSSAFGAEKMQAGKTPK